MIINHAHKKLYNTTIAHNLITFSHLLYYRYIHTIYCHHDLNTMIYNVLSLNFLYAKSKISNYIFYQIKFAISKLSPLILSFLSHYFKKKSVLSVLPKF